RVGMNNGDFPCKLATVLLESCLLVAHPFARAAKGACWRVQRGQRSQECIFDGLRPGVAYTAGTTGLQQCQIDGLPRHIPARGFVAGRGRKQQRQGDDKKFDHRKTMLACGRGSGCWRVRAARPAAFCTSAAASVEPERRERESVLHSRSVRKTKANV